MSESSQDNDVDMTSPGHSEQMAPPPEPEAGEAKYGGFTRFELELEFVQCLANPRYLTHLAASKYLADPAFVAYLKYLLYWTRPPYLKYLSYPGPTLKALRLLQNDRFRRDILHPDLAQRFVDEALRASVEWHREEEPVVVAPAQPAGGTGSAGSAGGDGKGG